MRIAIRLLLLSIAPFLLDTADATGQETSGSRHGASVAVFGGHSSAYRGGATYMVSALFPRASGVPFELAYEFTPTPDFGNAQIFWLGLAYPREVAVNGFYAGARVGFLDGPSYNGLMGDVHAGVQVSWRSVGIRLEPALLVGFDETPFAGGRLAAGLTWAFP